MGSLPHGTMALHHSRRRDQLLIPDMKPRQRWKASKSVVVMTTGTVTQTCMECHVFELSFVDFK